MPLDGKIADFVKTDTRPITRLIEALRGGMPNGFVWDFPDLDRCACGLAVHMGLSARHMSIGDTGRELGIGSDAAYIMFGQGSASDAVASKVRPRHVAAALEHYDRTGEALSPFHFVQKERGP